VIQDQGSSAGNDPNPNRKSRGRLRMKIEVGMGTVFSQGRSVQTWDGIKCVSICSLFFLGLFIHHVHHKYTLGKSPFKKTAFASFAVFPWDLQIILWPLLSG